MGREIQTEVETLHVWTRANFQGEKFSSPDGSEHIVKS